MTPLQKLPKKVGDLGKLIVAKGFKNCPKCKKSPNLVTLLAAPRLVTLDLKNLPVAQGFEGLYYFHFYFLRPTNL